MARMTVAQFERMSVLEAKADSKTITEAEGIELAQLVGAMAGVVSEARETMKESGLSIATDAQQKTISGVAESLTFNIEGNIRYFADVVLGNTLSRYNTIAIALKLPTYDSAWQLYQALDKLPPIFGAAVREGRREARSRYQRSWGDALDTLNKNEGRPKHSPTKSVK